MKAYFNIIIFSFLLNPLSFLLDNAVIADGDERLSTLANVVFIISNVILSYLFAGRWGIKGVAMGSAVSKLLFVIMISQHFSAGRILCS